VDDHAQQDGDGSHTGLQGGAAAVLPRFVGQWRDTLLIPGGGTKVRIRFLPVAWCGDMVLISPRLPSNDMCEAAALACTATGAAAA
jgi:hypothetical protein